MIKKNNKKAMTMKMIVMLIIALLAGLILMITAAQIAFKSREKADTEICRFSVVLNSKIRDGTYSVVENTPIECIATEYEAEDDFNIFQDMNMIAEQLDNCWYKTGAGELEVFGREGGGEQNHCLVCSEFFTKNDIKLDELKVAIETRNSNWYKKKKLNEYLSFREKPFELKLVDENGDIKSETIKGSDHNNYLVMYRRQQLTRFDEWLNIAKNKGKSFFDFETEEGDQRVFIVNEDGLSRLKEKDFKCNQLLWQKEVVS